MFQGARSPGIRDARSVAARIFTREEQAQNHCRIGNTGLALEVMRKWMEEQSENMSVLTLEKIGWKTVPGPR